MNIYTDGTALVLSFNTNQEARAWHNRVFCLDVSTEALRKTQRSALGVGRKKTLTKDLGYMAAKGNGWRVRALGASSCLGPSPLY